MKGRQRLFLIVISSLIFYAAWSVGFAFHFASIVIINHFLILRLHNRPTKARLWLILGIDLANLFLFKYFYLFLKMLYDISGLQIFQADIVNKLIETTFKIPGIVLPLAISFYSFQLMAYAVDVYRGNITEKAPLLKYMTFILFFPQLVAGPIMRHSDFFHQLDDIRPDEKNSISGMFLLMQGIIKKVIIADNILPIIHDVFAHPGQYDWQSNFMASVGFCARVYCDFSGYTDIARGLGRLLGLQLPENFRGPYLATSFRDLWTRWHVTLSTWMRDYLYFPLGGSRQTEFRNFITLVITFTMAGLWHGAEYQFLLWGFLHGILLAFERLIRKSRESVAATLSERKPALMNTLMSISTISAVQYFRKGFMILFIFTIWVIVAIPFNAPGINESFQMFKQIFTGASGISSSGNTFLGQMILITFIFNFLQVKKEWQIGRKWQYLFVIVLAFITVVLLGRFSPQGVDFIYFQF